MAVARAWHCASKCCQALLNFHMVQAF